jgi:16S rRNA (uracil1498-N3)-methyltransferase
MIRVYGVKTGNTLMVQDQDLFHLTSVLRIKLNETFELLHDHLVYRCLVTSVKPFAFTIMDTIEEQRELNHRLTLIYVIPKGEKLDWVIQKAVELGATSMILTQSTHSVVHWDTTLFEKKRIRFEKMISEATLQSKRTHAMQLLFIPTLKEATEVTFDLKLIASEHHLSTPSLASLTSMVRNVNSMSVLVGAEGGFTEEEVQFVLTKGYVPFSLGRRILRTETAAIVALAHLSYWSEQQ